MQHSEALRRLADVTQVLPPPHRGRLWDPVPRTRLTHSLECAQIGRDLARALGCDSDLVEAACLAHDLGHPPFGHVGEQALDELAADIGGFEANAQTLRLLTRLEPKYLTGDPDTGHRTSAGLNLTRATLDATCKYPWPRGGHPTDPGSRKFGVYEQDRAVFDWLRACAPDPTRRCFEAQVMDWADDIAFCVHDFEDGVRTGHIDLARLADPAEQHEIIALAGGRFAPPGTDSDELAEALARLRAQPWWPHRFEDSAHGHAVLKHATAQCIGRFCQAAVTATRAVYGPGTLTRYHAELIVPDPIRREVAVLKALTAHYVMGSPEQLRLRTTQQQLLAELTEALLAQAPHALSPSFAHQFRHAADDHERTRAVIDQISVLTDTHAHALHNRYVLCPA